MRLITCHGGRLHALFSEELGERRGKFFSTGLPEIDALLPDGGLARGAVHEILGEPGGAVPLFFAMLLARAAAKTLTLAPERVGTFSLPRSTRGGENFHRAPSHRAIVWCDPGRLIYAPALAAGMDLDQIYLLRPRSPRDLLWGMAESLRCPGVAAVIGTPGGLSRIEARRLQLAAETGGGTGLLLRVPLRGRQFPSHYAAATRWVVSPASGDPTVQRWKIRLIHCHGGDIQKTILLEHCRETNSVRAVSELADGLGRPGTAGA
jgi:protein ImuA